GQMQRAAGLAHDDAPGARLDKLDALLAQTSTAPMPAPVPACALPQPAAREKTPALSRRRFALPPWRGRAQQAAPSAARASLREGQGLAAVPPQPCARPRADCPPPAPQFK